MYSSYNTPPSSELDPLEAALDRGHGDRGYLFGIDGRDVDWPAVMAIAGIAHIPQVELDSNWQTAQSVTASEAPPITQDPTARVARWIGHAVGSLFAGRQGGLSPSS